MKTKLACFLMLAVAAAGAQTKATTSADTLPVGTAVRIKLETPLSTSANKPGDRFAGRVIEAVSVNGKQVIPVGASLEGHVLRADEPRRIHGTPTLDLRPETVILPNGERYMIVASLVDTSNHPDVEVNEEGEVHGRGHDKRDIEALGVGAAGGAGLGWLAGRGSGMLIGTGIGVAAATGHWLARHHSTALPAGTEIIMELNRPMSFTTLTAAREGGE